MEIWRETSRERSDFLCPGTIEDDRNMLFLAADDEIKNA